jgi:hypothetical protein
LAPTSPHIHIGLQKKFDICVWKDSGAHISAFSNYATSFPDLLLNREQPFPHNRQGGDGRSQLTDGGGAKFLLNHGPTIHRYGKTIVDSYQF